MNLNWMFIWLSFGFSKGFGGFLGDFYVPLGLPMICYLLVAANPSAGFAKTDWKACETSGLPYPSRNVDLGIRVSSACSALFSQNCSLKSYTKPYKCNS